MEGNLIGFNNRRSHFVTFIWVEQQSYFDNLGQRVTCPTLCWDCSGVSQGRLQHWDDGHKEAADRSSEHENIKGNVRIHKLIYPADVTGAEKTTGR